jgi:hypothetical protein
MKKVSKTTLIVAYVVLILILGAIGYWVGHKNGKGELYGSVGLALGAVISVVLWFAWGKSNVSD